jgi:CubicO group peptidase (beta-lactamase class C family)
MIADLLVERTRPLDIALHTVEVVEHGQLVESVACAPLTVDSPHRMYSVAKSLTALAVGLLDAEGALSLDDVVVSHFPEQVPVHPWLEAATVADLLAMRGPHLSTTFKHYDGPWVESWFRTVPTHRPGTLFTYDTSGSYLLAALVERLSGLSLVDYLRPRLLDPIGAGELRVLPGDDGYAHGGSGLVCSARDLRRIGQVVLDGGRHDGAAVLPAPFLAAMTSPQADTSLQTWGAELRGGYGYQTWLPASGGWMMFGMGGQIVHGDPATGRLVVLTADTQACPAGDQRLAEILLGEALPRLGAAAGTGAGAAPTAPGTDRPSLSWPAPVHEPAHARPVSGRWALERPGGSGNPPVTMDLDLGAGGDGDGTLRWDAGTPVELRLRPGVPVVQRTGAPGASPHATEPAPLAVVTSGWSAPGSLTVRLAVVGDEVATVRLQLVVHDDGELTVRGQGFGETVDPGWTCTATGRPV